MVLGTQVLMGFQFRAFLEPAFPELPRATQLSQLVSLGLLILAFSLLLMPAAFHRIAERGSDSDNLHRLISGATTVALSLLSVVLGLALFVACERVLGTGAGLWAGGISAALALALFYLWPGLLAASRRSAPQERTAMADSRETPDLSHRIQHVLTEARVALPGVQALLGFQIAIVLMEPFERIPFSSKCIHLGAIAAVTVAMLLLIAPAAFHRIVERGEETERFHTLASRFITAALVPLALGVSADVAVVVREVTHSFTGALVAAAVTCAVMIAMWLVVPVLARVRSSSRDRSFGAQHAVME